MPLTAEARDAIESGQYSEYWKRQCEKADARIDNLRKALTIVKAERDHWHVLVSRADRVQFPFTPPKSE